VVLAFLAVIGIGLMVGCTTLQDSRRAPLYEIACLAQCPIAHTLIVDKCNEIDPVEKATRHQACLDEAEMFRLACPLVCKELNPPPPEPEPVVIGPQP
jgi:hypothetical protein